SAVPPTPSGLSMSWFGPAPNPSSEMVKLSTRSLDMVFLPSRRLYAGEHRVLVLARVVLPLMHLETGFAQNTPPGVEREKAHCPMVGLDPKAAVVPNEIEDRRFVLFIRRGRVIDILDEDDIEFVPWPLARGGRGDGPVLLECFDRHVRRHNQHPA